METREILDLLRYEEKNGYAGYSPLYKLAADEIERLLALVKRWENPGDDIHLNDER